MAANGILLIKTIVKSSLDNYVLPGTLSGTEILWLYMVQWTRHLTALTIASGYLMSSQFQSRSLLERARIRGRK
jgi:hypothetical protein